MPHDKKEMAKMMKEHQMKGKAKKAKKAKKGKKRGGFSFGKY